LETKAQDNASVKTEKIASRLTDRMSVFLNMRYQYSDAGEGLSSFDIRRARIDFRNEIIPSIDCRVVVEFAGDPKILDAFVNWHSISAFNIVAGEFKVPFSLENAYATYALEMADNSMVIAELGKHNDASAIYWRDIGVNFYGKFLPVKDYNVFEYSVALLNGNGINVSDDNKSKDFSGIFSIYPLKEITLSASHYNGSIRQQDKNIQRVCTGGSARYDNNKLLVRGEYIYGTTGDMNSDGYYVVAGYFVHPKIQTLLKYDHFRKDISMKKTWRTNYIVGINYFPIKNFHFKLNYSFRTTVGSPDVNHIALQFLTLF
jgi:hypothetical protein